MSSSCQTRRVAQTRPALAANNVIACACSTGVGQQHRRGGASRSGFRRRLIETAVGERPRLEGLLAHGGMTYLDQLTMVLRQLGDGRDNKTHGDPGGARALTSSPASWIGSLDVTAALPEGTYTMLAAELRAAAGRSGRRPEGPPGAPRPGPPCHGGG